jgi:hypothetical protein
MAHVKALVKSLRNANKVAESQMGIADGTIKKFPHPKLNKIRKSTKAWTLVS